MASTKDYLDFIIEQLSDVPDVSYRPMMGEFLLYSGGVLFGGVYDDRLLVKKVAENAKYEMVDTIPYDGGKPMYLVEDLDDKEKLTEIVVGTCAGISHAK